MAVSVSCFDSSNFSSAMRISSSLTWDPGTETLKLASALAPNLRVLKSQAQEFGLCYNESVTVRLNIRIKSEKKLNIKPVDSKYNSSPEKYRRSQLFISYVPNKTF